MLPHDKIPTQTTTMLKMICFGSGSSGNCFYLTADKQGLLIDAGVGIRNFKRFYKNYGLSFGALQALLVTHEHTDHVKAAGICSDEWHLPVLALPEVHAGIDRNLRVTRKVQPRYRHDLVLGEVYEVGVFEITAFAVPHDSAGHVGYKIRVGDVCYVHITDAGSVTEPMREAVREADYLTLEANYEPALLEAGPYPLYLRRRIMADRGHLANDEAGRLLADCASSRLKRVWLCHLSAENNSPQAALTSVTRTYLTTTGRAGLPFKIDVLNRVVPTGLFDLV